MKKYYFLFLGSFVLLLFFNNFMQLAFLPMKSSALTPDTVDIGTIIRYCPTYDDFIAACDGPAATSSGCAVRLAQCPACTAAYPEQKAYCERRMGGGVCMAAYAEVTKSGNNCVDFQSMPDSDPKKSLCRTHLQSCVSMCNDPFKKACNDLLGGGSNQCQAAVDALSALTTAPTEAQKEECRSKCTGADASLLEKCDRIDLGSAEVIPPDDSGGPGGDDGLAGDTDGGGDTGGDMGGGDVTAGGDMSGMVNSNLQQQFLSGVGGMDLPDFNMGDQNPVDFTGGRGADGDYQGAAGKIDSASIGTGYRSNGININNQPWDKAQVGHNKPFKAETTPATAGRGAGGAGGFGGGSIGGGGPQGRPQGRRGGLLNDLSGIKNIGLNYHPPSGAQSGGQRRNAAATKNPRTPAARYKAKTNGEQAALNRLFGVRPAALPGGDINACRDTVFCHMERHFQYQLIRSTASEPRGR